MDLSALLKLGEFLYKFFRIPDLIYLKLIDPIVRRLYIHVLISLQVGKISLTKQIGDDTYLYLTKYRDAFLVGVVKFF